MLLASLQLSFPLKNPVLLFSLILFIILFAPIILNKLKIPHLIGLIIAGALIGPNGMNLMLRDSSIILFGTVGLLYIMFLAGLEIDLAEFKKNSQKSLLFGLLTFLIPMGLGLFVGLYILEFSINTSILMASMFASHTLITYPIVSRLGVSKNRAVNITVGGTLITDTLALLVLAVVIGISAGEINNTFWIRLGISVSLFAVIVMFLFPVISRWFFKRFDDSISQYIFVLGMVFLGAFLAEAAGIEAIIGAFLAGLALNRLIPHTSALMNRIEFVGNALFIPFFLIGVGMLIDYRAFFKDTYTIQVAAIMTTTATVSKFLAAWITQKTFRFSANERRLIFGLSNSQAAATLAAVLVGYNFILNKSEIELAALEGIVVEPVRLLNDGVLNGTILMILVTCTIASFVTQKGASNIALEDATDDTTDEGSSIIERILIPINNESIAEELVNLSITVKSKRNNGGIYALNVVHTEESNGMDDKFARKVLDRASKAASAADIEIQELLRYDLNTINGISNVVKEKKISDLILGFHAKKGLTDSFLGAMTEGILQKCNTTTFIYKSVQPLGTIKRHLIVVPDRAEKEIGFPFWLVKVWNIARNTGAKLIFYSSESTLSYIRDVQKKHPVEAEFENFDDWKDFLILARDVKSNDNLIIVLSRKDYPSFTQHMLKVPSYLDKYFLDTNYLLIYPMQQGVSEGINTNLMNASVLEPLQDNLDKLDEIGKTIANLFKRNK